jgi:hypothetical protein
MHTGSATPPMILDHSCMQKCACLPCLLQSKTTAISPRSLPFLGRKGGKGGLPYHKPVAADSQGIHRAPATLAESPKHHNIARLHHPQLQAVRCKLDAGLGLGKRRALYCVEHQEACIVLFPAQNGMHCAASSTKQHALCCVEHQNSGTNRTKGALLGAEHGTARCQPSHTHTANERVPRRMCPPTTEGLAAALCTPPEASL